MILINGVLSGLCVVIGATGLLSKPLRRTEYLILIGYVAVVGILAHLFIKQDTGLLMLAGLLGMIVAMEKEKKLLNLFMACLGYVIAIIGNNVMLVFIDVFLRIPRDVISEKYTFIFSMIYALLSYTGLCVLRKVIYSRKMVQRIFTEISSKVQLALVINIIIFLSIFLMNITLGEKVGYSKNMLMFNSFLFFISLVIISWVLLNVAKSIEEEEKQKAMIHQQKILESYVENLEKMLEETRAFRHDYKNILSTMSGFIRENEMEGLREFFYQKIYLQEGREESQSIAWKSLKNIKPMELKGFLYEKLLLVFAKNIEVQVNIAENLNVKYKDMEDLVRILGIFLDNAIEETELIEDGKIQIVIKKTVKGVIFRIENNCNCLPEISVLTQKGYSTKGEGRGNGLHWVEQLLEKHSDMFHELTVEEEKVVQVLEVIIN